MPSPRSYAGAALLLLVIALVLLALALFTDGNNTFIALAATACAVLAVTLAIKADPKSWRGSRR